MRILFGIVLTLLILLALSSGVTKVILMQQDVDFFGKYGFTNPVLIAYGALQILGGVLLIIPKCRLYGAIVVAVTFLVSAIVLFVDGNYPVFLITLVATALLGWIAIRSRRQPQ